MELHTLTFLKSAAALNAVWYAVNGLFKNPPRLVTYSAVGKLYNSSSVTPTITFSAFALSVSTEDQFFDLPTYSITFFDRITSSEIAGKYSIIHVKSRNRYGNYFCIEIISQRCFVLVCNYKPSIGELI